MGWVLIIPGVIVLVLGADLLVRGAASLATRLGIPPLVVGLTVVAFGTSSPEIAVSVSAVLAGSPDLALGNVVGSNTFNILFILGLSALIRPLVVHQKLVRVDVPIMIGVSIVFWVLARDGEMSRIDGMLLLSGIVVYTVLAIRMARRNPDGRAGEGPASGAPVDGASGGAERPERSILVPIALVVVGTGLTVLGARWLVEGSVAIASALGVSDLIIGLTIVAGGTSLPELATSVVAALRGQRDIAVGNVVGSNIFNVLAILGCAATVAPAGMPVSPALLAFDLPVMIAVAVACLPIAFTGSAVNRWEGALFLAGYLAYVAYLVLQASRHDAVEGFSAVMLWFALPLAALGVGASVAVSLRSGRPGRRVQP